MENYQLCNERSHSLYGSRSGQAPLGGLQDEEPVLPPPIPARGSRLFEEGLHGHK